MGGSCRNVLVAKDYCSSRMPINPERARDYLVRTMGCKVVEGIMSVAGNSSSARTPAKHRLRMVETAVRKNFWIRAGDFECSQSTPVRQIAVLRHYQKQLSQKHGEPIRLLYVCGSEVLDELVSTQWNSTPLWSRAEIKELLQQHGLIVLKRGHTHPTQTIYLTDVLRQHQRNIHIIEDETFPNDLRCSRIRTALRRGESVKYCLDDDVIEYINEHNLYRDSPCHNYESYAPNVSTVSAPDLSCTTVSTVRKITTDNNVVPPEPPQRGSSEKKIKEKYKDNSAAMTSEWQSPSTSQPSCSESFSSASEPSHIPTSSCQSTKETIGMDRPSVKWFDVLQEFSKPPKELPNNEEYTELRKPSNKDQKANQLILATLSRNKQPVSSTTTVKKPSENAKDEALENLSKELPITSFMKPILSQPQPAADSPASNGKATDCDAIPSCVISSVTCDARGKLRTLTESPAYDNVTLDDLLAASTSWAEYLHKDGERVEGVENGDCRESSVVPSDPPPDASGPNRKLAPVQRAPKVKEKKKSSWFFCRSKSMKDLNPPSDDESLVRICATDRRAQAQTSPEILWRNVNRGGGRDRWSELPPAPHPPFCPRHPGRTFEKPRRNPKGSRFGIARSADNMHQFSVAFTDEARPQTADGRVVMSCGRNGTRHICMSKSHHESVPRTEDGGVTTIRCRRYKLTPASETTV